MPRRRRRGWVKGDWLVEDEESGFTTYGKAVGRDYYGVLKVREQMDDAHPQMFIRAKGDPYPVDPISPPLREYQEACLSNQGFYVNNSTVLAPVGPATSIYRLPLGQAQIGCTFYVY